MDLKQLTQNAFNTGHLMRSADLMGWDPYDALLSPLFSAPFLRSNRSVRFAAQQAVLRSPINLRRLLRVK